MLKLANSFRSLLESCVKIGEGVYGEVFKAQCENGEPIALKVVAFVASLTTDFIFFVFYYSHYKK